MTNKSVPESAGLAISSKSNSFQFFEFIYPDLKSLSQFFELKENQCNLEKEQPGFLNTMFADDCVAVSFKEILSREMDVLEEGRVQTQKYWIVEEGHFVIFRDFMIAFGKPAPLKSGLMMILKFTKFEPKPAFITAEKIFKISEHMAFIRTMDLDRMEHPTIKKLHFDGKIETLSDIAPFHNYTSNIKSVKGVINTPQGIRTIKIMATGKIQISKKKEEELDSELFKWAFHNLIKGKLN